MEVTAAHCGGGKAVRCCEMAVDPVQFVEFRSGEFTRGAHCLNVRKQGREKFLNLCNINAP